MKTISELKKELAELEKVHKDPRYPDYFILKATLTQTESIVEMIQKRIDEIKNHVEQLRKNNAKRDVAWHNKIITSHVALKELNQLKAEIEGEAK